MSKKRLPEKEPLPWTGGIHVFDYENQGYAYLETIDEDADEISIQMVTAVVQIPVLPDVCLASLRAWFRFY